jgi:aldehyde:ferredoxin oxidoreductase
LFGLFGRLLLIDLAKSDIVERELEENIFRQYLGGKGLAAYLLLKMLPPGVEPLSPENILIITTGPASGSTLAPASRFGVFSKSPATGLFGGEYINGHLPPQIRQTGHDAIVITGAAGRPTYISISEEGVNFYDASEAWGLEPPEAGTAILKAFGTDGSQALVIGPDGEKETGNARISGSCGCTADSDGLGSVMGSKKLKGIVFNGRVSAQLADEEGLKLWNSELLRHRKGSAGDDPFSPGRISAAAADNGSGCSAFTAVQPALKTIYGPEQGSLYPKLIVDYEDRLNIFDSLIFCRSYLDLIHWEELIAALYLLTGKRFSLADLHLTAGCIQNLIRQFNLREGAAGPDDILPVRLAKESINAGKALLTDEEIEKLAGEYYLLRGWNEDGIPPQGINNYENIRRNFNVCRS